jgi:hypothetical protein
VLALFVGILPVQQPFGEEIFVVRHTRLRLIGLFGRIRPIGPLLASGGPPSSFSERPQLDIWGRKSAFAVSCQFAGFGTFEPTQRQKDGQL